MMAGLRSVADVPLGRTPASGPDRRPGVRPVNGAAVVLRLAGVAARGSRPPHLPGVAPAVGRVVPVPARRRAAVWCTRYVLHRRAYPTWADAAYLSFYVVAFGGLISFPSRRRTRSERLRLLLDMGTVFIGGAMLIWYVALGPAVGDGRRLRPVRPGHLRLPDRRPAAAVRGAVAAVARRAPRQAWCRCGSSRPACWCSSRPTSPTTTSPCTRPTSAATRSTRCGCWR